MANWLKNNWSSLLVFALILSVSLWAKHQFDQSNLEDTQQKYLEELSAQKKSYDDQIQKINQVNAETLERQRLIAEEYKNHLEFVQSEYERKVQELEELRVAKIKELKAIGSSFGFIAEYLNDLEIPSKKGGRWHSKTVADVINNSLNS